jgi:hypothetical protein
MGPPRPFCSRGRLLCLLARTCTLQLRSQHHHVRRFALSALRMDESSDPRITRDLGRDIADDFARIRDNYGVCLNN